jgi:uncharacterized protein (DUF1697 family)
MAKFQEQAALMSVHIALLRAINLGSHQPVLMANLRDLVTELGFVGVRSVLQTGNLVFRSNTRTGADLEGFLEAEAAKHLDLRTDFLIRTAAEWKRIVAHNPFSEQAKGDPAHLIVMFLKRAPSVKEIAALQSSITGPEIITADGRQVYIVYPAGVGRSRLTNSFAEKKLGARGTARNWNTVLKLEASVSEAARFADTLGET